MKDEDQKFMLGVPPCAEPEEGCALEPPRWDAKESRGAEEAEAQASAELWRLAGDGPAAMLAVAAASAEAEFDRWFSRQGLRWFRPHELRFLGGSHFARGHAGFGKNSLPGRVLWPRLLEVAHVADEARHQFGSALRVVSGYRSPAYNAAIGGASGSFHLRAMALDLAPVNGDVAGLWEVIQGMRRRAAFSGGVGRYRTFVHVDTRGSNPSW